MAKILIIAGDQYKIAGDNGEVTTVSAASIQYTGAKVGDIVELFKDGESYIVMKKDAQGPSNSNNKAPLSKADKKKRNEGVVLNFEKEGAKPIAVTCRRRIKPNFIQTYIELRFGIPPMDVSPVDWFGVLAILASFGTILLFAALVQVSPFFMLPGFLCLVFNFIITSDYFLYYIDKKLKEGYTPQDDETRAVLDESGLFNVKFTKTQDGASFDAEPGKTQGYVAWNKMSLKLPLCVTGAIVVVLLILSAFASL